MKKYSECISSFKRKNYFANLKEAELMTMKVGLEREINSKFCVNYKEIRKNLEFEVMELDAKVQLKYISTIAIMPCSN